MLSDGRNKGVCISCVGGITRLRIEKKKEEIKKRRQTGNKAVESKNIRTLNRKDEKVKWKI